MGHKIEYKCGKCGRLWVNDLKLFYLMSDNRLEHSSLGMLTPEISRRSIAKGHICESYCEKCDEIIKVYLIDEIKTEYPYANPEELLKEYEKDSHNIIGNWKQYNMDSIIKCKKCGKDIHLESSPDIINAFDLNCNIYEATCIECNENYMIYASKPPLRDYTESEVLDMTSKLLDNKSLSYTSDNYDLINNISCPTCNDNIPKRILYEKCPKCGGLFDSIHTTRYD